MRMHVLEICFAKQWILWLSGTKIGSTCCRLGSDKILNQAGLLEALVDFLEGKRLLV